MGVDLGEQVLGLSLDAFDGVGAGVPAEWRLVLAGEAVGPAHGSDVDGQGQGTADDQRLYQLIRQRGSIEDRTFEIEFLGAGAEAYCFTFG